MSDSTPRRALLVDSHAHLDHHKLARKEAAVLERARAAGVACIVNVGADLALCRSTVALARRVAVVYATVGVHPHDAAGLSAAHWAELERLSCEENVVAIGECGLDYFRDLSPRPVQREVFARHAALAQAGGLPIVVHCREAYADCLAVLAAECAAPIRGVMHCFDGDGGVARRALDLGLHIGIGGQITRPAGDKLRGAVPGLPLDRLLVETDCPYMTPRPLRGDNEPANVRIVAERLAELLDAPFEDVARATTRNARELFGLPGGLFGDVTRDA